MHAQGFDDEQTCIPLPRNVQCHFFLHTTEHYIIKKFGVYKLLLTFAHKEIHKTRILYER